ncbi:BppU family phage baseplate upper protein [Bacillus cereus]
MTFKTYEINVDLVHDTSTTCSNRFSQNDRNSAKLLITITNKGAELDLSQAKSVRMSFKKPDGTRVFQNDCQPINAMKGKYQIVLKTQTLTSVGNVIAQIHIEEEDRIIDTQKFFFIVNDSLASDEAVESTNDFTIIQKALELGEKFKNVDFDPIIAAGELAKGAVKKSGDTMTGNVDIDISVGAKSKGYRWKDASGALFGLETSTTGELILYDYKAAARIWQYDPVAKRFTVLGATNLLKNTGDTMTGNLEFDTSAVEKRLFVKQGAEHFGHLFNSKATGIYNWRMDKFAMSYNAETDTFNVGANNTNLLKKTGDTMTGDLRMPLGKIHRFQNSDDKSVATVGVDSNGRWYNWSDVSSKRVFMYDPATDTFTIDSANTNLVKKTGDMMTGNLIMANDRGVTYRNKADASVVAHRVGLDDRFVLRDIPNGKDIYSVSGNDFTVHSNFKTAKDGRADLTLTADAENFNGNIGPIADRRGNTVTLRAGLRRKAGATGTLMTTLPLDMRPTMSIVNIIPSTDGSPARVTVQPNGEVHLENATGLSISGKDVYMSITYVVN